MRKHSLFLAFTAAFSAAVAIALASSVSLAGAEGVVSPPAGKGKTSDDTESYWTPDRMRGAKPVPMPHKDGAKPKPVAPDERPADAKPKVTPPVGPKNGG